MFLAADYPEGNTKDGEYLAKNLGEAIKVSDALKMKPLLGSIVTDNAAVMLKANNVMENEEEYPDQGRRTTLKHEWNISLNLPQFTTSIYPAAQNVKSDGGLLAAQ